MVHWSWNINPNCMRWSWLANVQPVLHNFSFFFFFIRNKKQFIKRKNQHTRPNRKRKSGSIRALYPTKDYVIRQPKEKLYWPPKWLDNFMGENFAKWSTIPITRFLTTKGGHYSLRAIEETMFTSSGIEVLVMKYLHYVIHLHLSINLFLMLTVGMDCASV